MLRRTSSLTPSFGVLREKECPRCHRAVDLALGEMCDVCAREIRARAARAARWVSLGTTVLFAVYTMALLPPVQVPRLVGAAATAVWYLVTRRITEQVVTQWLRSR